jgi:hypothetical protein
VEYICCLRLLKKFWEVNQINCFERWTIPYFLEREKEKKRPCLRLNYPPDGKCNECTKGTCRFDKICFMCGLEGHGAFQTFPGGKLKGELKCTKHRNFLAQLAMIRLQHGVDEDGLRALFKLPVHTTNTEAVGKIRDVGSASVAPASATLAASVESGNVSRSGSISNDSALANASIDAAYGSDSNESYASSAASREPPTAVPGVSGSALLKTMQSMTLSTSSPVASQSQSQSQSTHTNHAPPLPPSQVHSLQGAETPMPGNK